MLRRTKKKREAEALAKKEAKESIYLNILSPWFVFL